MPNINDILNLKISYQANTWSQISCEPKIVDILQAIKSDKYKYQIIRLREHLEKGDKEFYDTYKKQLPAVTFSGTFNEKRNQANLLNYNPIIVIDIDKLSEEDIIAVSKNLKEDNYVLSYWKSPSDKGFKGLVSINYNFENNNIDVDFLHKIAFKKLSTYFIEKYKIELDKSGSDITRLCFLSYDTELIVKETFNHFIVNNSDLIIEKEGTYKQINIKLEFTSDRDILYNPFGKNNQLNRKHMTDIIRFLKKKKLSITESYTDWCKVAMAISNCFTYDIGLNYFLKTSALDTDKYNEVTCTNFLINCYESRKGNVNFGSITYLANQKGYKTKNQKKGVGKTET